MKKIFILVIISSLSFNSCTSDNASTILELRTAFFKMSIDNKGSIIDFTNLKNNKNHLSKDTLTSLMSLRINNVVKNPRSARVKNDSIFLTYNEKFEAILKMTQKDSHLTFELLSLTNHESVDLILWGPYPTTINKIIGVLYKVILIIFIYYV